MVLLPAPAWSDKRHGLSSWDLYCDVIECFRAVVITETDMIKADGTGADMQLFAVDVVDNFWFNIEDGEES